MGKEKVLEIEIVKVNDIYSIGWVKYQNEKILKLGEFKDENLQVFSRREPIYVNHEKKLYIRGCSDILNNAYPFAIKNENVSDVINKVNSINEKYGIVKRWCPRSGEYYFYISTSLNKVCSSIYDYGNIFDREFLESGNYFETKEEAEIYLEKIKKILKERE